MYWLKTKAAGAAGVAGGVGLDVAAQSELHGE